MRRCSRARRTICCPALRRDKLASHALDFWLTGEDLPDPDNRVLIDRDGGIRLHYRPNNLDPHEMLTRKLRHLLNHIGCEPHLLPQNAYFGKKLPIAGTGHQNGTIRFGHDPRASALDINCRAHEVDNLYVVDASFFPSSAAVNPTLTIIANALRVGDHLLERLGAGSAGAMIRTPHPRLCLRAAARRAAGARRAGGRGGQPRRDPGRATRPRRVVLRGDRLRAGRTRAPPSVGNARMRLGRERIVLTQRGGRPVPAESRSNDLWFQHLAIVVSDIDRAYRIVLRAGAVADLRRAAVAAGVEPECRRHPRRVFPRPGLGIRWN